MTILYILIVLLVTIILFLSLAFYLLLKKGAFIQDKEKEFIVFVIDIFIHLLLGNGAISAEGNGKASARFRQFCSGTSSGN
jgi:hypothetical protein